MSYCATPFCFIEADPDSDYCSECRLSSSDKSGGIREAAMQFSKLKPEAFSSNKSTHQKGGEK